MQVAVFLDKWIITWVVPFRRANTVACYQRAINALPPELLKSDLTDLDAWALQAAINSQAALYPRAAQLTYTVLRLALAQAVKLGLLPVSPMAAVIKPIHTPAKAHVLTADQLRKYIAAGQNVPHGLLLQLIAVYGLRRSEALGLQSCDVSIAQATLTISHQRLRLHGNYSLCPLKTTASYRVLPIPLPLLAALQRVMPDVGFLDDCTPNALQKAHKAVLVAAGLPDIRLHDLRHSMATLSAQSGQSIKILQYILGHSSYSITADLYADHMSASAAESNITLLSSLLFPA